MEKQQELKEQERIKESYCYLCNIFIESDKKNQNGNGIWNQILFCVLSVMNNKQKEYKKGLILV